MTHTAVPNMRRKSRSAYLRAPLAALFLLAVASIGVRGQGSGVSTGGQTLIPDPWSLTPMEATADEQQLTTKYFTIYYPNGEARTAAWYASFADDVDVAVSELLGSDPVTGLTLHIYSTEAEYTRVNPMAEFHPGIMAHAIPELKELGVAVERLRQEAPELARESFRHEMTHIVAGELSGQRLPIGFQEGLAQYNELSKTRGQEVVQILQQAQNLGGLLSWRELNRRQTFRLKLAIAYPQSYSVMAFLADRYGMGTFARFLKELGAGNYTNRTYPDALAKVYNVSIDELEQKWREYLPDFLRDGWKHNLLSLYDLGPGIALYEAGRFAEARDYFTSAEMLYRDLDREERAGKATGYREKAQQAVDAGDLVSRARQSLETHNYDAAQRNADAAAQAYNALALDARRDQARTLSQLAGRGLSALSALQRAREHRQAFNLPQAQAEALQAGEEFAALGDAPRVAEANQVLSELWLWKRLAGLAALGAGAAALLLAIFSALRARKRAAIRRLAASTANRQIKENPTWL